MRSLIVLLLLTTAASARPRAWFTSRGDDLPGAVTSAFRQAERRAAAGRAASIDVSVFSFTHLDIADELMRIAVAQPTVQVRVIVDLSQISHSEGHVAPYLEDLQNQQWSSACQLRQEGVAGAALQTCAADLQARYGTAILSNVQVKYKWYDGYEWSKSLARPVLSHTNSLLMHRKLAIVDGDTVVAGSFNWSPQAATSNYENLIVLSGQPERPLVQEYQTEFDAMWNDAANYKTGPECRQLRQVIWDRLRSENP
jgi:phosphatidylserine/phosphatidylglycerophosphate/cardiolipin synthase-like enzyme